MGETVVHCVGVDERFERVFADHLERRDVDLTLGSVADTSIDDVVASGETDCVVVGHVGAGDDETNDQTGSIGLVRRLRDVDPHVTIVSLSDGTPVDAFRALAAGATEFLERQTAMGNPAALVSRIEGAVGEESTNGGAIATGPAERFGTQLEIALTARGADDLGSDDGPSDRRFEAIFDNTYQFTGLLEPDGTLVEANEAALTFGGLERSDVVGRPLWEAGWFDIDDDVDAVAREAVETARDGGMYRDEVRIQGADRDAIIDFSVRPITDETGTVTMLVVEGRDVTDVRTYERRLERQRDELELLNQVVRHDIRNDLQLVQAYADVLDDHVDTPAGRDALAVIAESAKNAVDLTATARDLAEVMVRGTSETHAVALDRTLDAQLDEIDASHPDAVVRVEETLPSVAVVGTDMLGSVFRNLLKNAIQHNDAAVPEVTVSVTAGEDPVRVEIADNGPGISDAQKSDIFLEGKKGLESGGSGIGLYLVETLVEGYGGDVRVEDNEPRGTVFVVELPVAEESD